MLTDRLESSFTPDGGVMMKNYSQLLPTLYPSDESKRGERRPPETQLHSERWRERRPLRSALKDGGGGGGLLPLLIPMLFIACLPNAAVTRPRRAGPHRERR